MQGHRPLIGPLLPGAKGRALRSARYCTRRHATRAGVLRTAQGIHIGGQIPLMKPIRGWVSPRGGKVREHKDLAHWHPSHPAYDGFFRADL